MLVRGELHVSALSQAMPYAEYPWLTDDAFTTYGSIVLVNFKTNYDLGSKTLKCFSHMF